MTCQVCGGQIVNIAGHRKCRKVSPSDGADIRTFPWGTKRPNRNPNARKKAIAEAVARIQARRVS